MLSNPHHRNCPLHITLPTQPTIETPFLAGEIDTVETSVIDGWVSGQLAGLSGAELGLIAEAIDETAVRLGFLGKKKGRKAAARLRAQAQERARLTRGVSRKVQSLIEKSAAAQAEQTKAIIEKALADKAAADQAKADAEKAAAEANTQAEADKARAAAEQAQAVKDAADAAVKAALATQQSVPVAPGAPASLPAPQVSPLVPVQTTPAPSFVTPAPQAAPYYPQLPEPAQVAPAPQAAPYYPQLPEPAGKYAEASTGVPVELEDMVDEGAETPELEGYLGMLAAAPTGPVSVEVKPSAKPGNNIGKIALASVAGIGAYLLWRKFRPTGPVQGRLF